MQLGNGKEVRKGIYDITKTYLENAEEGPFYQGPFPKRTLPDEKDFLSFLGFPIASPLGVPAGPLLNSRWIELAAELGYDVLCYKTIRSTSYDGHPLPNVIFIEGDEQYFPDQTPVYPIPALPERMENLAITNSFGMPSRTKEYLLEDIPKAKAALKKGQVLIVSIVGGVKKGEGIQELVQDYVTTALIAKECGAEIIEVNFSCPNVSEKEGSLYQSPSLVGQITNKIVSAIGDIPLILKVGCYPDEQLHKEIFVEAASAGAQAIAGINTISKQVLTRHGEPALSETRKTAGICGAPIKSAALNFIRHSHAIIQKEKLGLTLIGCGGITLQQHFTEFLHSGADIAMTATGMMWDPLLAMRYHKDRYG